MVPKKKRLTIREQKFVKNIVRSGGRVGESALDAGFRHPSYGSNMLAKERIQTAIVAEMRRVGISDEKLAKKLNQGLSAYHPPEKEGGKKYPDFGTRRGYLDTIFKLRGDYAPEKHVTEKETVIVIDSNMIKGLIDAKAMTPEEAINLQKENIVEGELIEEKE